MQRLSVVYYFANRESSDLSNRIRIKIQNSTWEEIPSASLSLPVHPGTREGCNTQTATIFMEIVAPGPLVRSCVIRGGTFSEFKDFPLMQLLYTIVRRLIREISTDSAADVTALHVRVLTHSTTRTL